MKLINFSAFVLSATVLSASALSSAAMAESSAGGLFVEPVVTYERGDTSIHYPSPFSDSTGSVQGPGLGVRLGFHVYDALFLALDCRYAMVQFKDSAFNYDENSTSSNFGVTLGAQMPIVGLRIWATYVAAGELNPEASSTVDVKFADLTGYRVGAGFRIAIVSLNLEYQDLKYGKATLEKFGSFSNSTSFSDVELKNKSWVASVSFPFAF